MCKALPCVAVFRRVCLQDNVLLFDPARSLCDGQPCSNGTYGPRRKFYFNGTRFPITRMEASRSVPSSSVVGLLPSGLNNWGFRWWDRAPGAEKGPGATHNMAHALYDSVMHEIDAQQLATFSISVVLGDEPSGSTIVHQIRRRLFANATFRPQRTGCFGTLYSYSWSCDRFMRRYEYGHADRSGDGGSGGDGSGGSGSDSESSTAGASTRAISLLESLRTLRRLAHQSSSSLAVTRESTSPAGRAGSGRGHAEKEAASMSVRRPRTLLLYGRSDTHRRRLLNLSSHVAALAEHFPPPDWRIVLWDRVWRANTSSARPTLEEQLRILSREVSIILTPHGAFPSVWALLLPPATACFEIFSSCMTSSWLPAHVMEALQVRHALLAGRSPLQRSKRYRLRSALLDPKSGRPVSGCPKYPEDPDVAIEPKRLATVVSRLWERDADWRRYVLAHAAQAGANTS